MPSKLSDGITHLFPNFDGAVIEVWEYISDFIPQFTGDIISYACWEWDWSQSMLLKVGPGVKRAMNEKLYSTEYCGM